MHLPIKLGYKQQEGNSNVDCVPSSHSFYDQQGTTMGKQLKPHLDPPPPNFGIQHIYRSTLNVGKMFRGQHWTDQPPSRPATGNGTPLKGITEWCENITYGQTSFAPGN